MRRRCIASALLFLSSAACGGAAARREVRPEAAAASPADGREPGATYAAGDRATCRLRNGEVCCFLPHQTERECIVVDLGFRASELRGDAVRGAFCARAEDARSQCWFWTPAGIDRQDRTLGFVGPDGTPHAGPLAEPIPRERFRIGSCALMDDGRVMCWGENGVGELGDGLPSHESCEGLESEDGMTRVDCSLNPVYVAGIRDPVQLAIARGGACALALDSSVWCWGAGPLVPSRAPANECDGYVLPGDERRTRSPCYRAPVATAVGDAVQIVAGESHVCALLRSGDISCWGKNNVAQVGAPRGPVHGVARVPLARAERLCAGRLHTCALVGGRMHCWGSNAAGQLGSDPSVRFTHEPVEVPIAEPIDDIICGSSHSCAMIGAEMRCVGGAGP